jgi:D-alanyl-D-alanine dipeptidase
MTAKSQAGIIKVDHRFHIVDQALIARASVGSQPIIVFETDRLRVQNIYLEQNVPGALPQIVTRSVIKDMLSKALLCLPDERYGLLIFDAFRTLKAQISLFEQFRSMISANNPSWNDEIVIAETKKLVPLPGAPDCPPVMPHNSGGAIDLTLTFDGIPCDMGTPFDDSSDRAAPEYFEQEYFRNSGISEHDWLFARNNRRILFSAMICAGFSIHPYEWWHYNFGNIPWAELTGQQPIFGSMEDDWAASPLNVDSHKPIEYSEL